MELGIAHDGRNERHRVRIVEHPRHERAIDLQRIDGQLREMPQRGVAGAEVIHGEADAKLLMIERQHGIDQGIADRGDGDHQAGQRHTDGQRARRRISGSWRRRAQRRDERR